MKIISSFKLSLPDPCHIPIRVLCWVKNASFLRLFSFVALCALVGFALLSETDIMRAQQPAGTRAMVRHGFTVSGRIEGSVQQLTAENTTLNSAGVLTGDLFVPGTPTVVKNGTPTFGGVVQGSGSAQPTNYQIILNGSVQLGHLVTRTNPTTMPTVAAPPAATGTRDVVLTNSSQSPGNFATLRDLTLNGTVGMITVPPGTYRRFTGNGANGFVLGVAGSTQPAVYNLNSLLLNAGSQLQIVGPVVLTSATAVTLNAAMGSASNPSWLSLRVAAGGVTLNGGSALYGTVTAPSGTVIINANSRLIGNVICDRLTINSNGLLRVIQADSTPPVLTIQQPAEGAITNALQVAVTGTFTDEGQTTITVNGITAAVQGNSFTASLPLAEGQNTLLIAATDAAGNRTEVTRHVVRDSIAPAITVNNPINGAVTNATQIDVVGQISDATPTSVTVNNQSAVVNSNSFSTVISLAADGQVILIVSAVDAAGNQSETQLSVTRDTIAPALTLTTPTNNQVASTLNVSGTVVDAAPAPDTTWVTVTVNDFPIRTEASGAFNSDVDLVEGTQQVTIAAIDAAGNRTELTRTVTIDLTPPVISELSPVEGTVTDALTTVRGRVTDATSVTVKVEQISASVDAGGFFVAENVPIAEGEVALSITAVDAVGNVETAGLALEGRDRTPPAGPTLFPVISPTRLAFQTIEGRSEPGAVVTIAGGVEPVTANAAHGSGLFAANISLALGDNALTITTVDQEGNISPATQVSITSNPNMAEPPAGQPEQINISTGSTQKGLVATELPRPLIALVTDITGAPVTGVPVRFTVLEGGGQFVGGAVTIDVNTNAEGHASARYISGISRGLQQVRADFTGNTLTPAIFLNQALEPVAGSGTTVSGVVLDQNLRALPNVLVRIGGQQTRTGADGRFRASNVASGPHQLLELVGRDQITLPGRWPNITYDMDVLPDVENELGRPLFLPRVNAGIAMPLDADNIVTEDTSFELPVVGGEPPIRVTARAGTHVLFPPDVTDKRLSVTRIATNRVPMVLEEGRASSLYISVQPSGAVFETPLEISFPNLDGLAANEEVALMSFDHDAGRYVRVGTGHVSGDGRIVTSDPGSGIRVGAWHSVPPQPPEPEVTVLGNIQVAGNPAFQGKNVLRADAWVEGTRAVPLTGDVVISEAARVDYRATFSMPRNSPARLARMEAMVQATAVTVQLASTGVVEVGKPTHFLALRNSGDVVITATLTPAGTNPNVITWVGGVAGADNLHRIVRTATAATTIVTARVGTASKAVRIHVVNATAAPAAAIDAPKTHTLGGTATVPATAFGLTVVSIGQQGVVRPQYHIDPHFNADRWVFRLRDVTHSYRLGIHSLGRINLPNGNPAVFPLAPGLNLVASHTRARNDFNTAGLVNGGPPRTSYWVDFITQNHEGAHVTHFYSNAFWLNHMGLFESLDIEAATVTVIYNCNDATTTTGTAAVTRRTPGWNTSITTRHGAADAAEISSSETFAHGVSNPQYVPIRNAIPTP